MHENDKHQIQERGYPCTEKKKNEITEGCIEFFNIFIK